MKKLGDLFTELGFNKDASLESQKAFLKHLIKDANQQEFKRKKITKNQLELQKNSQELPQKRTKLQEEQLSFNFIGTPSKKGDRVS